MCRHATSRTILPLVLVGVLGTGLLTAQSVELAWRHIGNGAVESGLPALATGPVSRVWFGADGSTLYALTPSGRIFQTIDSETWTLSSGVVAPPAANSAVAAVPESGQTRILAVAGARVYAAGQNAYRSDDGGTSWNNLTAFKGQSLLGSALTDLAVSAQHPDMLVVAAANGIWSSADSGRSWNGLNDGLPNLPAGRLLGVPTGTQGLRLALKQSTQVVEWTPGQKTAWQVVPSVEAERESNSKQALSKLWGRTVTAYAKQGTMVYAGDSEGRLFASADNFSTSPSQQALSDLGAVEFIWIDPKDPRIALAAFSAKSGIVFRTMNGGQFWDDMTVNLPANSSAHGIVADHASGTIYVATDAGLFYTTTDLTAAGRATTWNAASAGLPSAAAMDVKLDAGGHQLYVALDGYGVYSTMAPHRLKDVRVVNAADYSTRAAAPGSLLSVLGTRVTKAGTLSGAFPILNASDTTSQIQVPFEATGNTLALTMEGSTGQLTMGVALQSTSPAIFVDPDGTPLLLDADTGVLLDASKPAHSGSRIQALVTGLGRVRPEWPTGVAAPLNDPPAVVAAITASLDGTPVEVTQAVLAPGYIGFYLVEIQIPRVVNAGPADLYIGAAEGQQSNHVRVYIEP
jgi:uncharacterized protein (TIGR03437 family)